MNAVTCELPPAKVNLVFESRQRRRVLLVKCRWKLELSVEDAAAYRRDLLEPWELDARYFMVAFTNGLYVWKRETAPDALPDFTASPESIWRAYAPSSWAKGGALRAECIEIAMHSWLNDHAWGIRRSNPHSAADQMLERSGLYEQMRNGAVRFDYDGDER